MLRKQQHYFHKILEKNLKKKFHNKLSLLKNIPGLHKHWVPETILVLSQVKHAFDAAELHVRHEKWQAAQISPVAW